jgi:predicted transcriptional regulator
VISLCWFKRRRDNRIKVIDLLNERTYDINQLAEALYLDYKSIQRHITVLEEIIWLARWEKDMGNVFYF